MSRSEFEQLSKTIRDSNRVVIFVDMLGFASLTMNNPLDIHALGSRFDQEQLEIADAMCENPLTRGFLFFHDSIEKAISAERMLDPTTAITFSDSAFIASGYLFSAMMMAAEIATDISLGSKDGHVFQLSQGAGNDGSTGE